MDSYLTNSLTALMQTFQMHNTAVLMYNAITHAVSNAKQVLAAYDIAPRSFEDAFAVFLEGLLEYDVSSPQSEIND